MDPVSGSQDLPQNRPARKGSDRTPLRELKLYPKRPAPGSLTRNGVSVAARPPLAPGRSRWRLNRIAIALALLIAVGTVPFTLQYQRHRTLDRAKPGTDYSIPPEKRQWRMHGLDGITDQEAVRRFGEPFIARNYNVSDGTFAGPAVGLKHFYFKSAPGFVAATHDAETKWTFPQYSVIREIIWKLPDSYLTLWFREPRAEVQLSSDSTELTLPTSDAGGDWICVDNYRVGNDLVKSPGNP